MEVVPLAGIQQAFLMILAPIWELSFLRDWKAGTKGKEKRVKKRMGYKECCRAVILGNFQEQMISSSPVQLNYSVSTRDHRTKKRQCSLQL